MKEYIKLDQNDINMLKNEFKKILQNNIIDENDLDQVMGGIISNRFKAGLLSGLSIFSTFPNSSATNLKNGQPILLHNEKTTSKNNKIFSIDTLKNLTIPLTLGLGVAGTTTVAISTIVLIYLNQAKNAQTSEEFNKASQNTFNNIEFNSKNTKESLDQLKSVSSELTNTLKDKIKNDSDKINFQKKANELIETIDDDISNLDKDKFDKQKSNLSSKINDLSKEFSINFENKQQEEERKRQQEEKLKRQQEILNQDVNKLCHKLYECVELNKKNNSLVSLKGNALIIGDLHGELSSASLVIDQAEKYLAENETNYVVFLGDYFNCKIDGNNKDVEVLDGLLDLKITYKDRVVLLSGNHEASYADDFENIKTFGNFTSTPTNNVLHNAQNIDKKIIDMKNAGNDNVATIKEFCATLPIAAEVTNDKNEKIFCVHGLIPNGDNYDWIEKLKQSKSSEIDINLKKSLLCNLYNTENDNIDKKTYKYMTDIDCICKNTVEKFINQCGYKCVVRGHSHDPFSKSDIFHNGSCYSIYSDINDYYNASTSNSTSGILLFGNEGIKTYIEYKSDSFSEYFSNLRTVTRNDNDNYNDIHMAPTIQSYKEKFPFNNSDNIISLSTEEFKKFIKDHPHGAIAFRGVAFDSEEKAINYNRILCEQGIVKAIETNHNPFGITGRTCQNFASNIYRAFYYSLGIGEENTYNNIYIAYVINDTAIDYKEKIGATNNSHMIVCKDCFKFNKNEYNEKKEWGSKIYRGENELSMNDFIKKFPDIDENFKEWVSNKTSKEFADQLWRNFKRNSQNIFFGIN